MSRRDLTPEELWKLELDEDALETLAMSPAEIRADLVAMGCDPDAIEKEGRAYLRLRKRPRLKLVALIGTPIATIGALIELLTPAIPEVLPYATAAAAPSQDPPAVADWGDVDGGSE
jgi:hypothetical protein